MCKDCATFFVKTDDSQKKIVYKKCDLSVFPEKHRLDSFSETGV